MARRTTWARGRTGALLAGVIACSTLAVLATASPASAASFSNATAITTTDPPCDGSVGPATLYPSPINVSGLSGTVSDVNVTLRNMNNFQGDFQILLVGPGPGEPNLVLLSDAGTADVNNFTLTLDDEAASLLPQNGSWGSSPLSAKPTDYAELSGTESFPSPAPSTVNRPAPTGTATLASAFDGINPNGTWNLYVVNDACDDPVETIANGWTLDITTNAGAATTTTVSSSLNPSITGSSVTFTATVTSSGPVTTGTVTFREGATTLAANVAVNGSGQAAFSTSSLSEGNHVITATYNGAASFGTSSGSVNQRVNNPTTVNGNQYCNTGPITINAVPNPATPYPSNILVSGGPAVLGKVTVTLKNVTHDFAEDIDVLLVGPSGQNLVLLSDASSTTLTSNVTVTLDDGAAGLAPSSGALGPANSSVTYRPTDYDPAGEVDVFASPAPAPSAATTLAAFNGTNPNGTWSLYVVSDGAPETGSIAGGWCITLSAPPELSIADTSTVEGNAGTTLATFTITRTGPTTGPSSVQWSTLNGSAVAPDDYAAVPPTTVNFAAGETTKTVSVTVNGDTVVEPDDGFTVVLSSPSGATIGDGTAVGRITNDDTATFSIGDATVTEGDSGTKQATFTISRAGASGGPASVQWFTLDAHATAGSDYVPVAPTTVTFAPGETSKQVSVTVNGDTAVEPTEDFYVRLGSPVGATVADGSGLGTITNDDLAPANSFSVGDATVTEGDAGTTQASFTVSRSGNTTGAASVQWFTLDGTATAGVDYQSATPTTLNFAAGETSKTVVVTVNGDTAVEANETFVVRLTAASGATIADGSGLGRITNDDAASISVGDATVTEGDSGNTTATFTVSRTGDVGGTATVSWSTANGTATAGSDYVAVPATTLTFGPGETTKTVSVTVKGDTATEPNETFLVRLAAATGATMGDASGLGRITNDD